MAVKRKAERRQYVEQSKVVTYPQQKNHFGQITCVAMGKTDSRGRLLLEDSHRRNTSSSFREKCRKVLLYQHPQGVAVVNPINFRLIRFLPSANIPKWRLKHMELGKPAKKPRKEKKKPRPKP